jgi:hypothetical protein
MGWDMVSGTVKTALGISDNGIITGRVLFEGVTTGFVLIPIPEPLIRPLQLDTLR